MSLCPCAQHCPCASCPLCPTSCCSTGALALPWHTRHRGHGRAQRLPPAFGRPARPGRARDSLGLPAQKPFSSFQAGCSPARRSSLASSFQAGAGGLGSGLSCAAPGCSPSTWGWVVPGGQGTLLPCCRGHSSSTKGLPGPPLLVLPVPRQGPHHISWARYLLLQLGRQSTGVEGQSEVQGESPPCSNQRQQRCRLAVEEQ